MMSTTHFDDVREHLAEMIAAGAAVVPENLSMKFRRVQGPATGAEGREFAVSGPKANKVRALIFADLGLTRKQISDLVGCSVSRVAEVVWGLEHDDVEFPEIPLRAVKPEADEPKPGLTPQDDSPEPSPELMEQLEASVAAIKAAKAEGDDEAPAAG